MKKPEEVFNAVMGETPHQYGIYNAYNHHVIPISHVIHKDASNYKDGEQVVIISVEDLREKCKLEIILERLVNESG
jgi:hypothetical protein